MILSISHLQIYLCRRAQEVMATTFGGEAENILSADAPDVSGLLRAMDMMMTQNLYPSSRPNIWSSQRASRQALQLPGSKGLESLFHQAES